MTDGMSSRSYHTNFIFIFPTEGRFCYGATHISLAINNYHDTTRVEASSLQVSITLKHSQFVFNAVT